jgi:hypothetical protein
MNLNNILNYFRFVYSFMSMIYKIKTFKVEIYIKFKIIKAKIRVVDLRQKNNMNRRVGESINRSILTREVQHAQSSIEVKANF